MNSTIARLNRVQNAAVLLVVLLLLLVRPPGAQAQSTGGSPRPVGEARIPSLVGASGLLRVPSAYVQRNAEVAGFLAGEASRTGSGGVLAGVANRLEVGLSASGSSLDSANVLGSAKLNVVQEQLLLPAVSIGVLDAGNSGGGVSGYAVVSKDVIPYYVEALTGQPRLSLKVHAGYGGGLYRHNLFAGAELWGASGLSAIGEFAHGRVSLGARCYHKGFAATVAWLDLDHIGGALSYAIALR
jgi:hypothetical protein